MKRIATVILFMILPLVLSAQPGRPRPEDLSDEEFVQMQSRDMAEWLGLEEGTKTKFISTYGAFRTEINSFAKKSKSGNRPETEEEFEKMMQMRFEVSEKILEVRKHYYSEFKKFLKPSQIWQMYRFENEAGRRMQDGPGRPDGRPGEPGQQGPEHFRMGPPPEM